MQSKIDEPALSNITLNSEISKLRQGAYSEIVTLPPRAEEVVNGGKVKSSTIEIASDVNCNIMLSIGSMPITDTPVYLHGGNDKKIVINLPIVIYRA